MKDNNFGNNKTKMMKQPELGKKITEFRNECGLTQEQLAEKANINIRTIQRIEAGEVMPRLSTLKIIMESLGKDFEEINGENGYFVIERPEYLNAAWIAGIIMVIIFCINTALIILRDAYHIRSVIPANTLIYLGTMPLIFFFNRGFIHIGKMVENYFLVITGITGIILGVFHNLLQATYPYEFNYQGVIVARALIIFLGFNGIFHGIGLLLLKKYIDNLAVIACAIVVFVSVLCIIPIDFIQFLAGVLSIPSLLFHLLILSRFQKQQLNISV